MVHPDLLDRPVQGFSIVNLVTLIQVVIGLNIRETGHHGFRFSAVFRRPPAGRESNITYDDYGNVASVLDANGNGYYFEFDYDDFTKVSYAMIRSSAGMVKLIFDSGFCKVSQNQYVSGHKKVLGTT